MHYFDLTTLIIKEVNPKFKQFINSQSLRIRNQNDYQFCKKQISFQKFLVTLYK